MGFHPPPNGNLVELEDLNQIDRKTWRRYLFYMDLAIFAVFGVSLTLLIRHTFLAGQLHNMGEFTQSSQVLWQVVADTAFLVASFSWILYRFFRNEYLVMVRRY